MGPIKTSEKSINIRKKSDEIKLLPVVADAQRGLYENVPLLQTVLGWFELYEPVFANDFDPRIANYGPWLSSNLNYVNSIYHWFFIVTVGNEPRGAIWVENWEYYGGTAYSVEISGFAAPGTNIQYTRETIQVLLKRLFEEEGLYIVRGICEEDNRAARLSMLRAGMRHPETRRAWKIRNGEEITGIILSVTQPEFEHG